MGGIGAPELIIFLLVILLLFGSTKLPKLAKSLGEAQKEFKKGISEARSDKDKSLKGGTRPPADPSVNGTPGPDGTDSGPGIIADRRD